MCEACSSFAESLVYRREHAPFRSVDDLALRVPELSKANLAMLARVGALNNISADTQMHRRDALWQVEKAGRRVGPPSSTPTAFLRYP